MSKELPGMIEHVVYNFRRADDEQMRDWLETIVRNVQADNASSLTEAREGLKMAHDAMYLKGITTGNAFEAVRRALGLKPREAIALLDVPLSPNSSIGDADTESADASPRVGTDGCPEVGQ